MADEKQERKVPLHNCYICDKEFDKFSLEEHFFTFHNNKVTEENIKKQIQTINKCESCGKSFSNAGYLKRHIHYKLTCSMHVVISQKRGFENS